jgi:hypothetical protein
MATNAPMSPQQVQMQNLALRNLVLGSSQDMKQSIFSATVTPATQGNVVQIPLRNVGLVKGFIVEIVATLTNSGAGVASVTQWNAANLLSNVSFFDLDNYQRINTTGWHLHFLGSAKEGRPFASAQLLTAYDTPVRFGNNTPVIAAPATIAASGGTGVVRMMYYVPLAYSKNDLRGAVFMGVVNATASLQLTLNPTPSVATGDAVQAIYTGATTNVAITNAQITVYQCYLDQLPRYQQGQGAAAGTPILPPLDVATQYRLVNTTLTGVAPNEEFPVPFSNFQDFLSTTLVYNRAGTLGDGSDINYFALQAANTLQLFRYTARTQALLQRSKIGTDYPLGTYMFDFRDAPISTNQTGNMQMVVNANLAPANTLVQVGFESFALVNTVLGAASLPAG